MAYSELVKNFERIRSYMRQFYIYGFKRRDEYEEKSARSYDNERRRVESWLGEYMGFRRDENGKQVYLSVDSRVIAANPLHNAFKTKSFTDKDITLHFYILDQLQPGVELSVNELTEAMDEEYLCGFPDAEPLDNSTLRKKLKEYEQLGILSSRKRGREVLYSRKEDTVSLEGWEDALHYFTEAEPLGVVGSFLLDRLETADSPFRFKHHYLLHTLDSEILYQLLDAIRNRMEMELTVWSPGREKTGSHLVRPLKIYVSVQNGRQYLLCRNAQTGAPFFFRLDTIHAVKRGNPWQEQPEDAQMLEQIQRHLWGVSLGDGRTLHHIEMDIVVEAWEGFLVQRLEREKRGGTVFQLEEGLWRFCADVYDPKEMLPWLRTFIGRIVRLECSDPWVVTRFYEDLDKMIAGCGGIDDAVS